MTALNITLKGCDEVLYFVNILEGILEYEPIIKDESQVIFELDLVDDFITFDVGLGHYCN